MKTKNLIFILVLLTVTMAHAQDPLTWLKQIEVSEGVHSEMYEFFKREDPTNKQTQAYIANFIPNFHNQMVLETERYFQQISSSSCKPTFVASFPGSLTKGFEFKSKAKFEGDFLKVESYACLGKLNIDKVFQTLMSERFQRNVIDGVQSIEFPANNRVCVSTSTSFLTTNYCVTKQALKNENQYFIQSFNDLNRGNADKIFFKDTINVITQLSNGEITLYNLMYARGKAIPGLFKGSVRSSAKSTYEKVRLNLIQLSK